MPTIKCVSASNFLDLHKIFMYAFLASFINASEPRTSVSQTKNFELVGWKQSHQELSKVSKHWSLEVSWIDERDVQNRSEPLMWFSYKVTQHWHWRLINPSSLVNKPKRWIAYLIVSLNYWRLHATLPAADRRFY